MWLQHSIGVTGSERREGSRIEQTIGVSYHPFDSCIHQIRYWPDMRDRCAGFRMDRSLALLCGRGDFFTNAPCCFCRFMWLYVHSPCLCLVSRHRRIDAIFTSLFKTGRKMQTSPWKDVPTLSPFHSTSPFQHSTLRCRFLPCSPRPWAQ
jgi:hypothetical protein